MHYLFLMPKMRVKNSKISTENVVQSSQPSSTGRDQASFGRTISQTSPGASPPPRYGPETSQFGNRSIRFRVDGPARPARCTSRSYTIAFIAGANICQGSNEGDVCPSPLPPPAEGEGAIKGALIQAPLPASAAPGHLHLKARRRCLIRKQSQSQPSLDSGSAGFFPFSPAWMALIASVHLLALKCSRIVIKN